MNKFFILFLLAVIIACTSNQENKKKEMNYKTIGSIERNDPALDNIISANAKPEIIAEGFEWSEGPLWVESKQMLLFSDVPMNTVYKWTEAKGKEVYLNPPDIQVQNHLCAKNPAATV